MTEVGDAFSEPAGDHNRRSAPGSGRVFRLVGAGVIAGSSDVDPTTVATMVVVGASTMYGLFWLVVLVFPMLAVIQIISSRLGVVTRSDLQSCVTLDYGRRQGLVLLTTILTVTVVTIAADLEAGAAALGLLFHSDLAIVRGAARSRAHRRDVDTAQQAAEALRPLAGSAAEVFFAAALPAPAVVALPVMMATCAYAVGAEFDWERAPSW